MVGIFSRFSVSRDGHRRTQSALDERKVLPPSSEATTTSTVVVVPPTTASTHGTETAIEFKPVEHPIEPLDSDQPVQCPLPEPSILNYGRIWKERVSSSSGVPRRPDMQEQSSIPPHNPITKPRPPSNRVILPSISAPEHNILKLLEECSASSGL